MRPVVAIIWLSLGMSETFCEPCGTFGEIQYSMIQYQIGFAIDSTAEDFALANSQIRDAPVPDILYSQRAEGICYGEESSSEYNAGAGERFAYQAVGYDHHPGRDKDAFTSGRTFHNRDAIFLAQLLKH